MSSKVSDGMYLLEKANRFMNVAEKYISDEEYKDITAFNLHMALELSLNFVVEKLLRNYKPPMYMAYKREFPVQTTHNLSHVCYVLSSYVDFPTYLSFVVMQMTGWCVNSRYSEEFADSIEGQNLQLIYNAVKRFLETLELLMEVKEFDGELEVQGLQCKMTYYRSKVYAAAEDPSRYSEVSACVGSNSEVLKKLFCKPQEDHKFICVFLNNVEMVSFRQILVKLMAYPEWDREIRYTICQGLDHLHIEEYSEFVSKLGGYASKYKVTEKMFNKALRGGD